MSLALQRLRIFLAVRDESQAKFARRAGINVQHFNRIMREAVSPGPTCKAKIEMATRQRIKQHHWLMPRRMMPLLRKKK